MFRFAEQLMIDAGEIIMKLCQQEMAKLSVVHAENKE